MPKKEDDNLWIFFFGVAILVYTIYFHLSVEQYDNSIKGYFPPLLVFSGLQRLR
jgi:hypothetical protein